MCTDEISLYLLAEMNDDVDPPDNFRWLSVVPTQEDILQEGRPFLRRNKIDGSYKDAEHYLDVQFRLLREDFMRPLREGIAQLLERMGSARIGALQSLQDIRVYSNVRLLYPVCTSNGIRYRIKFDISKLRHVRWDNSKRLIFGSLICLSKDKFASFVLATVADRELCDIRRVSSVCSLFIVMKVYLAFMGLSLLALSPPLKRLPLFSLESAGEGMQEVVAGGLNPNETFSQAG